ncbi:MAG: alpha/beta hydrolase [Candidatus Wallbacteria bacterium]|nr:alpha/beta hydrolase [Candidatus Wallbacteria bacterium]
MTCFEPVQDVFLVERMPAAPASRVGTPGAESEAELALVPDPQDLEPLGDRTVVILAHGYSGSDVAPAFDPQRDTTFSKLAEMPAYRALWPRAKFYRLAYRPGPSYPELAKAAASLIAGTFPRLQFHRNRFVFVGHSAGGLLGRLVAADPRFWGRVAGIVTVATPHHGSVTSSLLQANALVGRRIGLLNTLLLRHYQGTEPDTAGMRSLAFDDFDGSIGAEAIALYGMPVNLWLRAFNVVDPHVSRIVAYQGVNRNLWGRGQFHVAAELQRRALEKFHPSWGSADPIVHLPSGTFAGKELAAVHLVPGRSHSELMADPAVLTSVLHDVEQFHRAALADELHAQSEPVPLPAEVASRFEAPEPRSVLSN